MEIISYIFMAWVDPKLLALTALGTFAGIYVGAIPGLTVTMAVSILMSFTFRWGVQDAMAMMLGVYMGGIYGGARPAILLNIPGTPSSIATSLDGYPLAQKGEAGPAIGLSTVMSGVGALMGILLLAVATPWVSEFALRFQPRDYFMVAVLGILLVGSISGGNVAKGIFGGALGVVIGTIGLDPMTATERFTFGNTALWNGVSPLVAMMGLFGIAEVLRQLHFMGRVNVIKQIGRVMPSWRLLRKYFPLSVRSGAIGAAVGALPGTGGDVAALLAYDVAKRTTKDPETPFGQGAWEGLAASESANNATVGSAFIPMLTLGIPGDAVTAIFIGALFIHGLNPGPMLMIETPYMFWFVVGTLTLSTIFMVIFGLTGIKLFTKLVEIPKGILMPLILVVTVVGAYGLSNSITDVYWVLGFGLVGYLLKIYGFEVGPVVLGVILSRLIEDNWRRTMISAREDLGNLLFGFVSSPLSMTLFIVMLFLLLSQTRFFRQLGMRSRKVPPNDPSK